MCDQVPSSIPLPSGWAKNVKSAVLHVISLAHHAIEAACGWAANSITPPPPGPRRRPAPAPGRNQISYQLLAGEEITVVVVNPVQRHDQA